MANGSASQVGREVTRHGIAIVGSTIDPTTTLVGRNRTDFDFSRSHSRKPKADSRLDVADQHELGVVRIDGTRQLITENPMTHAHGIELRSGNPNIEAIGTTVRAESMSATGWNSDVDSLRLSLVLPPGWRALALFGADHVEGDWLTAWSLLDLFLLLVFSIAVYRLWGGWAGAIAFWHLV